MPSQQIVPPHIHPDADGTFDSHYHPRTEADALLAEKAGLTDLNATNAALAAKADQAALDSTNASVTANTAALAPGNPGEVKGTGAGGTITNLKPGRIDARVRGMSPSNSDDSALHKSLLQEAATTGAELWLPDGTYKSAITIDRTVSGAKLAGRGTIQGVGGQPPIMLNGDLIGGVNIQGFTFEGIALDGAGVNGCVRTTGGGPIDGVTFRGVRFRNTATSGTSGAVNAIADGTGVKHCLITECVFEASLGGGINLISPHGLQITDNRFEGQTSTISDFIAVTFQPSEPYPDATDGLVITGNVGFGGGRMAVEIFSTGGVPLGRGVIVADNWFDVTAGGNYGISVVGADGAQVINNTVVGTGSYGLEIGSCPQTIIGNRLLNFQTGIILNTADRSTVIGNVCRNNTIGINVTTNGIAGTSCAWLDISDNRIFDPRDTGINLVIGAGGKNGGSTINRNYIYRSRVDADDNTRTFVGIQSNVPTEAGNTYEDNWIIQAAASPTLVGFRGYNFSGTNTKRSSVIKPHVINLGGTPFGVGVNPGSGAVSLQGITIKDADFRNLSTPMDTTTQQGLTVPMQGNAMDVLPTAIDSRGFFSALSVPPAKASEVTNLAGPYTAIRGNIAGLPVTGDGYWRAGDWIIERAPVSGGPAMYVCTSIGNPGTVKKAAPLIEHLSATATLDFPSIAAGTTATLTITVTGAAVGDAVYLGPPAALEAGLVATGYVSATNTVTVRLANVTTAAIDPASATWRATVLRPS